MQQISLLNVKCVSNPWVSSRWRSPFIVLHHCQLGWWPHQPITGDDQSACWLKTVLFVPSDSAVQQLLMDFIATYSFKPQTVTSHRTVSSPPPPSLLFLSFSPRPSPPPFFSLLFSSCIYSSTSPRTLFIYKYSCNINDSQSVCLLWYETPSTNHTLTPSIYSLYALTPSTDKWLFNQKEVWRPQWEYKCSLPLILIIPMLCVWAFCLCKFSY